MSNTDITLPISHHLMELRIRTLYILLSIIVTFVSSYYFSEEIFYILANPLISRLIDSDERRVGFIYTDITEAFVTYLKISLFTSIYICFPIIIYQYWIFLVPGLYDYEKKQVGLLCILSFILFSLGQTIAYFIILPIACKFFISFEIINSDGLFNIHLQPKVKQYLLFVVKILFIFGISFQFPISLIILVHIDLISSKWFIQKRNISCVFSFILAALLSPPDVLSQIILAVPLFCLYEIAIFTMKLLEEYIKIRGT